MTPEQKQRALQTIEDWDKVTKAVTPAATYFKGEQMSALLQELINAPAEVLTTTNQAQTSSSQVEAPEPEPVAYATGYYAGCLSIATVDGRVLPAGTALYAAPPHQSEHHLEMVNTPAPSVPDGWIRAIDEAMVVHHIGIADRADSYEVAKKKLNALLAINSDIARDCSEAPADLVRDIRLQVESEFAALLPGVTYMDDPDGGSTTVQEQVKRMALDAERYRWLLKQAWFQQAADRFDLPDGGLQNRFEKCMDEFIDAAMSEKGQS